LDNICHTLVGAALGEAGLKRRTPLATATLLIGANLPDVDAWTYAFGDGPTALAFRRGWTHGVLAMAVLPVVLAGAMLGWDRLVRRRRRPDAAPARSRPLLLLAFVSVLSHPLLDFLNTYGVRFLHPFSNRWFYGDALFIVDVWVWIALLAGIIVSRVVARRGRTRPEFPARVALAAVGLYVAAMLVSSRVGRSVVANAAAPTAIASSRVLVSPIPIDPFRRMVVVEDDRAYRMGTLDWLPRAAVSLAPGIQPKNDDDPAADAAKLTPAGRKFMVWARFPYFEVRREGTETLVTMGDARYRGPTGSWAQVTVAVPESTPPSR
jgi:inner membrane protein